ncbi:MAG: Mov34/MPN/PAD-1 family protein [Clostridiales bacterium]|jgi:hypothetical protein|nr:Mov34/MPN/PAD-1 family protein [Clostridiales bacterium]
MSDQINDGKYCKKDAAGEVNSNDKVNSNSFEEEKDDCTPENLQVELTVLLRHDPNAALYRSDQGKYYVLTKITSSRVWTFMIYYSGEFPKPDAGSIIPIKPVLVLPTINDLPAFAELDSLPFSAFDRELGSEYIFCEKVLEASKIQNSNRRIPLSEIMYRSLEEWVQMAEKSMTSHAYLVDFQNMWKKTLKGFGKGLAPLPAKKPAFKKYIARSEREPNGNANCKKIILSKRADITMYSETLRRKTTETGGIFMGHYRNGIWYVVEATDPGINAVFTSAYHEGDQEYYNNVLRVVSRLYKHKLELLGMWHRHPGSFDSFSGTDDATNLKFAETVGNGAISALINMDPEFRLTFYYVSQQRGRICYYKTECEVSDDYGDMTAFRTIATKEEVKKRHGN